MLICLPWKGSGGGVVYGFGVWRVKSWVKNVPDTNKYIAVFPIKWGWSRLTYLPLVVIISEKSIILFYWIPFRGLMLAIKNLFIFWPLLNPLYGIDTTMREWGIRNEESAIIFPGWTGEAGITLIRCGFSTSVSGEAQHIGKWKVQHIGKSSGIMDTERGEHYAMEGNR